MPVQIALDKTAKKELVRALSDFANEFLLVSKMPEPKLEQLKDKRFAAGMMCGLLYSLGSTYFPETMEDFNTNERFLKLFCAVIDLHPDMKLEEKFGIMRMKAN